jgi:DNA-binding LacI/PurR family transcriptional regulator
MTRHSALRKVRMNASTGTPRFRQIQEQLLRRIASGELAPGDRLPPLRVWAGQVGVAYETMSKAVRELVAKGVLEAAPRRGTVVAGRGRARRRAGAVGVVSPGGLVMLMASRYYHHLLPMVQDELAVHHSRIIFERFDGGKSLAEMFDHLALVDGIILLGNYAYPVEQVRATERLGVPVVFLGGEMEDPAVRVVRSDDFNDVREAVGHLARTGHSRIAVWTDGPADPRLRGFRAGMAEQGLPVSEAFVFYPRDTAAVVERLSTGPGRPTALLVLRNLDRLAAALLELRSRGVRVGTDLYICAYDDDLWRTLAPLGVPYAHIEQQMRETARAAATALLRVIEGNPAGPMHILLHARFIAVP